MKVLKRALCAALAAAMLVGCGSQPAASPASQPGSQPARPAGDRQYVNGTIDVTGMPEKALENKK